MKMPSLEQVPIGIRFIASMLVVFVPLTIFTVGGILSFNAVVKALDEVVEEGSEEMYPIMKLQIKVLGSSMPVYDYLINGRIESRDEFYKKVFEIDRAFEKALLSPFELKKEKDLFQLAREEWLETRKTGGEILTTPDLIGSPKAAQLMERFDFHIKSIDYILTQVHEVTVSEMNALKIYAANLQYRLIIVFGIIFIVGFGTAAFVSIKLIRSVLLPVKALMRSTENLAKGDLTCRVPFERKDELGMLGKAFNIMAEKLEKNREVLEKLATTDSLTDVYNHREFYHRLNIEINRSLRYDRIFSVLILDVDNFKEINDTYGHPAGDCALLSIAATIMKEIRPQDVCARYGGDEFTIILPETPIPRALSLAERIRRVIAENKVAVAPRRSINITVSIGLAEFPKDGKSAEELIFVADKSLYTSKRSGRNIIYHDPDS